MALSLLVVTVISSGSRISAGVMVLAGLLIASIGIDPITAVPRFTLGTIQLSEGLDFAAMALGLFGVSEIFLSVERMANIKPIIPHSAACFRTGRS